MDAFAKLITSVAALVGAVAWPLAIFLIAYIFRTELRSTLSKVPILLDRLRKASLPGLALELDRVADAEAASGTDKSGNITPRQIEAATRIQTQEVDAQSLLRELDRLCLEYDSLRLSLPSGEKRTRAMTRVIVKMRSLAPSVIDFLDAYKGSGSAGSRLAAIAMMQMVPRVADLAWLKDRFSTELPFLLYHAALALQNVANVCETPGKKKQLREVVQRALDTVKSFSGAPDQGTVEVLSTLLASLPQN